MADGGSVIFKFEGNDKPLQKAMASATNTLGSIGKTALKTAGVVTAALGTAFVGLVSASVKARGEIEQQIGGTEAVFGQYANEIQEMAKKSFETMGTSANDYMATINKMGALMKGSGIETKTAMDLSSQAMQRAADVASVMGISMEDAMNSIAGAAKGNFTMMDNLGVAMNATTLENYALEKGLNKTYNTMTNAEKIQLAMEMFLEKTAYAAGNYTKENETLAGSISTLKAAWGNFLSGAGDLSQVVSAVTNTGKIIIKSVVEIIPELIKELSQAIPQVIEIVQELMPQIIKSFTDVMPKIAEIGQNLFMKFIEGISQNIPKLMETVNQMIMTFTNWIIQNLPKIIESGIKIIVSLVNGIAQMLPTLIPQAVNAIITIVEGLLDNIDKLIEAGVNLIVGLAEGLILAIPILIEKAPEIIEKLFSAIVRSLPKIAQAGGQIIGKLVIGIIGSIIKIVETAPKLIAALVNGIRSGFHAMVDVGVNLIKGLWQGILSMGDWIKNKVKEFAKGILDGMKKALGIHSPSTLFRDVIGKNLALGIGVGFEDEMSNVSKDINNSMKDIIPDINSTIGDMFDLSPTLNNNTNSSSNVTVQVYNNMETDMMGNLINNIKTFSNGSKNDYNYGLA